MEVVELMIGYVRGSGWPAIEGLKIVPRTHLYENFGHLAVTQPIRDAYEKGVTDLILTSSVGGLRYKPGTVVNIMDHINLTGRSPKLGFAEMGNVWSWQFAPDTLPHAILAVVRGPEYETPAEAQMLRNLGADVVGMSMALEAMTAHHLGMRVVGLSLVTDEAGAPVTHQEVLDFAKSNEEHLTALVEETRVRLTNE